MYGAEIKNRIKGALRPGARTEHETGAVKPDHLTFETEIQS